MKARHTRGQRGLIAADLVRAALMEIERAGLEGFSLRCAARAIGCDVATLSYHFGSKEGLERAVADSLQAEVHAPQRSLPWQERFVAIARTYRKIAKRHPNAFALLLRFWTTGPSDLQVAEEWHKILFDAGLPEEEIPALGFATYAAILGVCSGEIGGLLSKPSAAELANIEQQDDLPLTKKLLPIFARLRDEDVFEAAITNILLGIEALAAQKK
ncbi:TetR/AcrR family transcriptional regulator [Hyphomicrobium sp.]|uniref:TetR/AcrR family transcriptional regulator n=1 Tax=Hyphomicrobium sp. TaxID=82 RepID=UPI000F9B963A|nr:TetR/AcrR family transcriptional regulator [Hyphomicrobium sp.]RUP00671.1 MAG: TetR/AcrR family transcriptional regulator [Hyphomicrobium sp.]